MAKKSGVQPEVQPVAAVLRPGAVVRLKSGGPKMTVKSQEGPEADVWCNWFAGAALETGCFGAQTLVLVEERKKKKAKV